MKLPSAHNGSFPQTGSAVAAGGPAVQALPAAIPRHVVLIHGIWDTLRTLREMETRLRDAGFDPIVVSLSPNDGRTCLDTLGEQVHRQVEGRLPHGERFSIVGFSMGGLVARSYLRQFGDPKRVEAFVSIASPHHGTWMAWLSGGDGIRDMRPGSKFLSALDEDVPRFSSMRWVTIRTPFDLIIIPSASAILPWAENFSFPVPAHPLLVLDGRVLECTLRALGAEPVSTRSAHGPQASRHEGSPPRRNPGTPPRR